MLRSSLKLRISYRSSEVESQTVLSIPFLSSRNEAYFGEKVQKIETIREKKEEKPCFNTT